LSTLYLFTQRRARLKGKKKKRNGQESQKKKKNKGEERSCWLPFPGTIWNIEILLEWVPPGVMGTRHRKSKLPGPRNQANVAGDAEKTTHVGTVQRNFAKKQGTDGKARIRGGIVPWVTKKKGNHLGKRKE